MNRIQFYVLTGLSVLLALLIIVDIVMAHKTSGEAAELSQAQQICSQGQQVAQNLRALLNRIQFDLGKTGDQGIKDLLARQQISFKTNDGANTNSTQNPSAPSGATH
jgi:hypothetical protein